MEGLLVEANALAAASLLATGVQPTTLTLEQMRLLQQRCLQVVVLQTQVASPETPRAAPYPPQTFATGRTTTSQFPQSKDNARTSRLIRRLLLFDGRWSSLTCAINE
ncbi:hypothetical protein HaLaN_09886, partial [Haematococcus lacustris]